MGADPLGELELLQHLLIPLENLDGVPALLFLGEVMDRDLFDMGQGVLHRAGEAVLRDGPAVLCRLDGGLGGLGDAVALQRGDLHDPAAELTAQLLDVDAVPGSPHQVHHVQRDHHGDAQLGELGGQVEVALQVRGVHDVQDGVRLFLHEIIPGHHLFQRVGGKGIDAGQVGQDDLFVNDQLALLFLHGDAGPVADKLVGAGQLVEQGGFAAVRVARQGNAQLFVHLPASLFHFDHFGVSLADRELIVSHVDLHGVAQRGQLAHIDLYALGDAHVHDAALDRALAVELQDLDGLADFRVSECFHPHFSFICILLKP